jgi:hypothetical protein
VISKEKSPSILTKIQERFAEILISSSETRENLAQKARSLYVPSNGKDLRSLTFARKNFNAALGYLVILHSIERTSSWFYIRIYLEDFLRKSDHYWLIALLNEELLEEYLKVSSVVSRRIFSLILKREYIEQLLRDIQINFEREIRPKRPIRHRGYRDKGSLPDSSQVARRKQVEAMSFTILERKREINQQKHQLEISILESFLRRRGFLTAGQLLKFKIRTKKGLKNEQLNRNSKENQGTPDSGNGGESVFYLKEDHELEYRERESSEKDSETQREVDLLSEELEEILFLQHTFPEEFESIFDFDS